MATANTNKDSITNKSSNTNEVLILGAGASGLAAAARLSRAGVDFRLIEARDRIGGRVFTVRDPIADFPMELGAEFIHGEPTSTLDLVRSAKLTYYDGLDTHFERAGRDFTPVRDYWAELTEVMEKLDPDRTPDRSFAEFLREHGRELDEQQRNLVIGFVEGFHASDANQISERGLAVSEQTPDSGDSSKMFRITEGYDRVMLAAASRIDRFEQRILFRRAVKTVRWSKGRVEVDCIDLLTGERETHEASRAIVTLPLGVLRAPMSDEAHVAFEPQPKSLAEALEGLRMGAVFRVTFRFSEILWPDQETGPIGFLHAPHDSPFPVWWTPLPARRPFITGWVGGRKAETLTSLPETEVVSIALRTLAPLLDIELHELRSKLLSVAYHDWQRDPYSRGAYSYITVGGKDAAEALSLPVEETLYFAGEATRMGEERATVSGAIQTGERAAERILASL